MPASRVSASVGDSFTASRRAQPPRVARHRLGVVVRTLLVVAALTFVGQSPNVCDAASVGRRRPAGESAGRAGGGGAGGGGGGGGKKLSSSPSASRVVACPGPACRCRSVKSGEVVARCTSLPSYDGTRPSGNATLAELAMRRSDVTQLPSSAFRGVRTKSLDLTGTRLQTIADDAFAELASSVESLTLSECGLSAIPGEAISRLSSLRVLHLEDNSISEVPGGVLATCCSSLRELYLYRNRITRVDRETFSGLGRLEKLSLAENGLESFEAGVFSALTSLVHLDLGRNRLHRVADGWLSGLGNLRWLELTSNRLRAVGRSTFRGAPKLRYMMADNNELTTIEDGAFRVIRRLSYLSIDVANSSTLTAGTLAGTGRLKTLIFGELRAAALPVGFFGAARRLKYLSLSNSDGSLQTNTSGGLRPELFHADFRFRQLNVWLRPIIGCRCSEPWIRALGTRGVYVHGYCEDDRPLSCTAGGKAGHAAAAKMIEGARGKSVNGRLRSGDVRR